MPKLTLKDFIEKSIKIHGLKYDYSKSIYTHSMTKITIICPLHGEFHQVATYHLQGKECPRCGRDKRAKNVTYTQEEFINEANQIHNFKYDYSKTKYLDSKSKIIIICQEHGEFEQRACSHLQSQGCSKCNHKPTYSKTEWIGICNSKFCTPLLYIIRCFNETEEFIKIGITSQTLHNRFIGKSKLPYSYEIIKEIRGSPDFLYDKEKELHKLYKEFKYSPLLPFSGQKECFNISILQDILKH